MLIRVCHYQRRFQINSRGDGILLYNSVCAYCTELNFQSVENDDLLGSTKPACVIMLVQAE